MTIDRNGRDHEIAGVPGGGRFKPQAGSEPDTSLRSNLDPEIISSRRALLDVIVGLAEHREALTVLGGHAVIEVTQRLADVPPPDTTRDGDLGVIPEMLGDDPKITERMVELGYETARPERPGVWSPVSQRERDVHDRDSVDLIAPYEVSYPAGGKKPRRAARVGEHGQHAVSATKGTELSLIDRSLMMLRDFDGGASVEAYVAGPAALLCAKAYKIYDRLDARELARNAERLRGKDFADLYRLMLVIEPEEARRIFRAGEETSRIGHAVTLGRKRLIHVLGDDADVAARVADEWDDPSLESELRAFVSQWRERFASS